ncbi:hypothetical protein GQ600_23328 [Phytophthora cactorum]|nr:hypothetical protein GQ600_23328 [Phytophthora cactorum]
MATSSNCFNTISAASARYNQFSQSLSGSKRKAEPVTNNGEPSAKRPYYGKCQYKTGKCFNERTLKRNGEAHTLCEEHRIKQNLIQRRSDRKYQTVHAIRRRERSQRRAVLKKQVSMAVAQQLFYEHQQQKTLGIALPQHYPLHLLAANANCAVGSLDASNIVGLAPPIQVPHPASAFILDGQCDVNSPLVTSLHPRGDRVEIAGVAWRSMLDRSSPTGVDNFTLIPFLDIPEPWVFPNMPVFSGINLDANCCMGDSFAFMPIPPCSGEEQNMTTNKGNNASSASAEYSKPPQSVKREPESVSVLEQRSPYYGKCQYKTGKCFNERTLKRNGEAHSLCEEHRVKQNLIQRRSDRKYQTVTPFVVVNDRSVELC